MPNEKTCFGFLRRRECLVPTWRGWLLLIVVCALFAFFLFWEAQPFLAMDDPQPGGILVVEGWAPDYTLRAAIAEYHRGHYAKLYVTGGPLEKGGPLSEYKTLAELGAATLLKLGLTTNDVQAVPAAIVMRDRTYNSALFLRKWLLEHHETAARINLLSVGAHARRSRLLFQKAFGKEAVVGVMALEDDGYDPRHWWHYSAGVRTITAEAIAYIYARFLFHPEPVPGPASQ